MTTRRFLPPWSVEEQPACFIVPHGSGQRSSGRLTENLERRSTESILVIAQRYLVSSGCVRRFGKILS